MISALSRPEWLGAERTPALPMKWTKKSYAASLLVVSILLLAGWLVRRSDSTVIVYDARFRVYDHRTSKAKTHTIYSGNQTDGFLRTELKHRLGLNVEQVPSLQMGLGQESFAFLVRYGGKFPFEELDGLRAVLTNDDDLHMELQGIRSYDRERETFIRCYALEYAPTNPGSYRLVLMLKSHDEPVAEWQLGELN